MLVDFGRSNLLQKARQQPDKVKQVLDKVRTDGLVPTFEAVRSKMESPIALGYCHAGVVREVGRQVTAFQVGDRVVSNGSHAEYVRVPWTLAARIPEGVSFDAAAFTPLAAIGLQGLRLAAPTIGETVVVYGLGLIGLLTAQLAKASGCRVIGIDRVPTRLAVARSFGIETLGGEVVDLPAAVRELTGGVGADIVLLTLSTESDEPAHLAAEMSRQRGRLVLVGVAGLSLRREDFFKKELSFQVSCSYGPGRYDTTHEEGGVDYPLGHVRWTEARNFAAVLQLMASGAVNPIPLITHRVQFDDAPRAYEIVTSTDPGLGIVLEYPERDAGAIASGRTVKMKAAATVTARGVIGCIGAGNFASRMLMPAFEQAGATLRTIVSSGGSAAAIVGGARGFENAASETDAVLTDSEIDTVVIATRHDTHARLTIAALRAGKHVFVEKPLALSYAELEALQNAHEESGRVLCVGFNRRCAPLTQRCRQTLVGRSGPLALVITVNAGSLPSDHWTRDPAIGGGRVLGEGCHFIDLARYLVGHAIAGVQVTTATSATGARVEDISGIHLTFSDGSIASIHYLANGHRSFPKERIEMFWDSRTLRLDNFRRLEGFGAEGTRDWLSSKQDKGHSTLVAQFLAAVRGQAEAPIPAAELFEVSRWSIKAGELAMGTDLT